MKIFGDNYAAQLSLACKGKRKGVVVFFICFLAFTLKGLAQDSRISGIIKDAETSEPILFGTVTIYQQGQLITGAETDFDGRFSIPVELGIYDIKVSYVGYFHAKKLGAVVAPNKEYNLDIAIEQRDRTDYSMTHCFSFSPPLIEQDAFESGRTFQSVDIQRRGGRN